MAKAIRREKALRSKDFDDSSVRFDLFVFLPLMSANYSSNPRSQLHEYDLLF